MEEVDEIVLHTLRQTGCEFEVNSLKEFTTDMAMEGVVRCLNLINPSLELSDHIPPSMSGKYRLGATLASALIDLGFKGEIGYQTFLYSNETDIRKIFLFLFENLPKESERALDEPLNRSALILKEVSLSLSRCINRPWLPIYCRTNQSSSSTLLLKNQLYNTGTFQPITLFEPKNSLKNKNNFKLYYKTHLSLISNQADGCLQLNSSILESNSLQYIKQKIFDWDEDDIASALSKKEFQAQKRAKINKVIDDFLLKALQQKIVDKSIDQKSWNTETKASRFVHSLELQFTSDKEIAPVFIAPDMKQDSLEEKQKKREEEIKDFQDKVDSLTVKLNSLSEDNKKYETLCMNIKEVIKNEEGTINEIKEKYRVKKCTLSLLPDADANIEKLQSLIDSSSQRLISLAQQWEQHRVPLIEEFRNLRELSSKRVNETQRKLEEIKTMREKIQSLGIEARQKEDIHKHLVNAYEKLTKDVSRSSYTKRILEIVGNIKKQKAEIDKVLLDTRNVQKEINKLSGKLERTFTVTDELIFRDAKKDEAIRRAYKYLAALHENCSQLVQIVEETGSIVREIRELEDQIDQENQKQVAANLERITSDYKQMQKENALLLIQLK